MYLRSGLTAFAVLAVVLSQVGCGVGRVAGPEPAAGIAFRGMVHGGQQPVVGAHLYLLAANTTGYGQASKSLLLPVPGVTALDASGGPTNGDYYVSSAADGSFSITGDYVCTANEQVYVLAVGGDAGAGPNSAVGLMSVLGSCPGVTFSPTAFIQVNEVTTVAAAYSMAGFAVDATHVSSSGSTLALKGISDAFQNAFNIAGQATGTAQATTPTGGTGNPPHINTIADILASCVNSTGSTSSNCTTLMSNARSAGVTGTVPTETATAAINIAHNPGAAVGTLYGLLTGIASPFPAETTVPYDFTVQVRYPYSYDASSDPESGVTQVAVDGSNEIWVSGYTKFTAYGALDAPANGFANSCQAAPFGGMAFDTLGSLWLPNVEQYGTVNVPGTSVCKQASNGSLVSPTGGYTGGGLYNPETESIAIDGSNHVWIRDAAALSEFDDSGQAISPAPNGDTSTSLGNAAGTVAIDGLGFIWASSFGTNTITKFTSAGVPVSGTSSFSGGGLYTPRLAIDNAGNVWSVNNSGTNGVYTVSKFTNLGVAVSPSTGYTGGGLYFPTAIAIDGAGTVWVANFVTISNFSSTGVALSPAPYGYVTFEPGALEGIAVDASGDVWTAADSESTLVQLIGAAAPVVVPLSAGVAGNTLGTRP
jgi:hypothetical protein